MTVRNETRERAHKWWLTGAEQCQFCGGTYAWEIEQRCVRCDQPMCPICVTVVKSSGHRFCPDCWSSGR